MTAKNKSSNMPKKWLEEHTNEAVRRFRLHRDGDEEGGWDPNRASEKAIRGGGKIIQLQNGIKKSRPLPVGKISPFKYSGTTLRTQQKDFSQTVVWVRAGKAKKKLSVPLK